jgi:hypothetical protein
LGDPLFQGEQRFQPDFFGFSIPLDVFPAPGKGQHHQQGDDDTFDEGILLLPVYERVLISLKKSIIGGTVSGIMIASSLTSIGFFISPLPLFNALALGRSPGHRRLL